MARACGQMAGWAVGNWHRPWAGQSLPEVKPLTA